MFDAFRSRNYALFWFGSFASNVGTWIQSVALGWYVYDLTHTASSLGLVSFAGYAPALLVGLVAGVVADRMDHKTLLVTTRIVAGAGAFLLAILAFAGMLEVWQVIAIAIASGLVLALYMPAVQAMLPSLVPPAQLLNAVSLNAVNFNLARITGPLIAGFAYPRIGAGGCFALNGASSLALVAALLRLDLPRHAAPSPASIRSHLLEGAVYARSDPLIVAALILGAGISVFGFPYVILMPAVARDVLHLGPDGLGLMMATVGAGAVSGGLALASVGEVSRKMLLAVTSGLGLAFFLVTFTFAGTLPLAVPSLFLLGVTQVACVASLNTSLQVRSTDAMRGRIMSMLTFSLFGLSTLGSLVLGAVGDRVGIDTALRTGGLSIAVLFVSVVLRVPGIFGPVERTEDRPISSR